MEMTCIAAVKHEGAIYMGADGIGTSGGSKVYIPYGKIVRRDNMLLGVSGISTWLIIFRLDPNFPKYNPKTDFEWWLNFPFSSYIRNIARERGYILHSDDVGETVDLNVLVGYNGELYIVNTDLSGELIQGRDYCAAGSGRDEAFGALYATQISLKDHPQRRVETALNAAAEMRPTIQGPFTFEVLKSVPKKETEKQAPIRERIRRG